MVEGLRLRGALRTWGAALLLAGAVAGCGSDQGGCTPGASVACACIDGRMGAQVCGADRQLAACVCRAPDGAIMGDATSDVLSGDDATPSDQPASSEVGADVVPSDVVDATADNVITLDVAADDHPEADVGVMDAGAPDRNPIDAAVTDAGPLDTGPLDTGVRDTGPVDAGALDAGVRDTGPGDAGGLDAAPDVLVVDVPPPDVSRGGTFTGSFVAGAVATPGAAVRGNFLWHGAQQLTGGGITLVGGFR